MTGQVSLEPLVYFLIVFMWTPPHLWALALFARDDYARVGIPMMPNVAGDESTRRQILVYAALLAPIAGLPYLLGQTGPLYGVAALIFGAEFVRRAVVLWRRGDADRNRAAKSLFGYSIVYLFGIFGVRLIEAASAGWIGG
jgi:protoheme IX farnesyltransferase